MRRLKSRAPRSLVVSHSPDDMTSSICNSRRCLESDYSNEGRMREVLARVAALREPVDESLPAEGAR